MSDSITVLKLGGSVLRGEHDVARAVHEIYRFRRDGERVVAVVSAFHGVTDRLLARGRREGATGMALAELLVSGERNAAASLSAALDAAGVPSQRLDPCELRLETRGPPFDADPVAVDLAPLRAAVDRGEVVVIPGFFGRGEEGGVALLGRGGSDLSALFLAAKLVEVGERVRCRLIKDVPALFEWDPALPGPAPRAFASASFGTAQRVGGRVLQPKAIAFAREHDLEFEVAGWNSASPSSIGAGHDRYANTSHRERRGPLRVALLGCGTVNRAVLDRLAQLPELFRVEGILVRDIRRFERRADPRFTADPEVALDGADCVVEAIGGDEPAHGLLTSALERGIAVVTANKSVMARHGDELSRVAANAETSIRCSAAAGGAMPVLEIAARLGARVDRTECVLNGTTAFVLEKLARGDRLPAAIDAARSRGLCEAEPRRDLDGTDAAEKLVLIARALGIQGLTVDAVARDGLDDLEAAAMEAAASGRRLVQVASLAHCGGRLRARVALQPLEMDHSLSATRGEECIARFTLHDESTVPLRGRGAGGGPTAESVIGDLLALSRFRGGAVPALIP